MANERPPGHGPAQPEGAQPASIGNDPTAIPAGRDVDAFGGDPETKPESAKAHLRDDDAEGEAQRNVVGADGLLDVPVRGPDDEVLGRISRVLLDLVTGDIAFVILDLDGIARGRRCAVPWPALSVAPLSHHFSLPLTPDDLRQAPSFEGDDWPDTGDPAWLEEVHLFFGCRPYWVPSSS